MSKEFHDLSERLLNRESHQQTYWANLGYWQGAANYAQACRNLADQLGSRLDLTADTWLFDVGFGCGDQLLHWSRHYGVQDIAGLNLSMSQTMLARQRLQACGLSAIADNLQGGDASQMLPLFLRKAWPAPDAIVALDCAYHFKTREAFLADAARLLKPGGRLALTDFVIDKKNLSLTEHMIIRLMASLSRIPRQNLISAEAYQQQWRHAGFEILSFADISDQVMTPFGDWLKRYKARHFKRKLGWHWLKYDVTAIVLRWASSRGILRYIVCSGHRLQR